MPCQRRGDPPWAGARLGRQPMRPAKHKLRHSREKDASSSSSRSAVPTISRRPRAFLLRISQPAGGEWQNLPRKQDRSNAKPHLPAAGALRRTFSLALCFAVLAAAQNPPSEPIFQKPTTMRGLRKPAKLYYSSTIAGLKGFDCEARPELAGNLFLAEWRPVERGGPSEGDLAELSKTRPPCAHEWQQSFSIGTRPGNSSTPIRPSCSTTCTAR